MEQANVTFSPLDKLKLKIRKKISRCIKRFITKRSNKINGNFFFLKDQESNEIKYELHKSKRYENKIIRENSFYESSNRHMVLLYLNQ